MIRYLFKLIVKLASFAKSITQGVWTDLCRREHRGLLFASLIPIVCLGCFCARWTEPRIIALWIGHDQSVFADLRSRNRVNRIDELRKLPPDLSKSETIYGAGLPLEWALLDDGRLEARITTQWANSKTQATLDVSSTDTGKIIASMTFKPGVLVSELRGHGHTLAYRTSAGDVTMQIVTSTGLTKIGSIPSRSGGFTLTEEGLVAFNDAGELVVMNQEGTVHSLGTRIPVMQELHSSNDGFWGVNAASNRASIYWIRSDANLYRKIRDTQTWPRVFSSDRFYTVEDSVKVVSVDAAGKLIHERILRDNVRKEGMLVCFFLFCMMFIAWTIAFLRSSPQSNRRTNHALTPWVNLFVFYSAMTVMTVTNHFLWSDLATWKHWEGFWFLLAPLLVGAGVLMRHRPINWMIVSAVAILSLLLVLHDEEFGIYIPAVLLVSLLFKLGWRIRLHEQEAPSVVDSPPKSKRSRLNQFSVAGIMKATLCVAVLITIRSHLEGILEWAACGIPFTVGTLVVFLVSRSRRVAVIGLPIAIVFIAAYLVGPAILDIHPRDMFVLCFAAHATFVATVLCLSGYTLRYDEKTNGAESSVKN